ncbi:MAG: signal peptidase I [Lachnospiraceae bacterium]|nr:signal peptidase I [Lachnospiraceae bacterium]
MNKELIKEIISNVLYFGGVLILALLIVKYVVQRTEVEGQSMEPTLYEGENLMVDKMTYRFREPKRYEIIVLRPFDDEPKTFYVKRIIGLPGETVQIKDDGCIYVNGEKLYESYGKEVIKPENFGRAKEPVTLGEDEYFVMGDNRNNSGDSRSKYVGNIQKYKIVGRAWIRIWPLNKFGSVKHK